MRVTLFHFNGVCAGLAGLKSGHVEKVLVFKGFLKGPSNHGYSQEQLQGSEPVTFGATLWSLGVILRNSWVYEGTLSHFEITLESLWSDFGYMESVFDKHSFPQRIFIFL